MTTKQVASLVTEAIALDQQIDLLSQQLADKKQRLIDIAARFLLDETDLKDPQNSGATYSLPATDGNHTAQISWPKPRLISGIWLSKGVAYRKKDDQTIEVGPIRELSGAEFETLFFRTYKPAKAFRELAPALLAKPNAEKLIELCEESSSPRVNFRTKGPAE
jgi:hypothetical protein